MQSIRHLLIPLVLSASAASASFAAVTIHTPVSLTASSSLDDGYYDESNLLDAVITEASINTSATGISASTTTNFGDSWAADGDGVLVLDMGSSLSLDGLLYAQRTFNGNNFDDWGNVDVWVRSTNPGAATGSLPFTLGSANATFALLQDDNGSTLRRYDLGVSLTGRYVVLNFRNSDLGFPGGQELRLISVPEPAALGLLTTAAMGLFARRRPRHPAGR